MTLNTKVMYKDEIGSVTLHTYLPLPRHEELLHVLDGYPSAMHRNINFICYQCKNGYMNFVAAYLLDLLITGSINQGSEIRIEPEILDEIRTIFSMPPMDECICQNDWNYEMIDVYSTFVRRRCKDTHCRATLESGKITLSYDGTKLVIPRITDPKAASQYLSYQHTIHPV